MKAELYICNLSFKCNESDTRESVINKIGLFCDLIRHLALFPSYNSIYFNPIEDFAGLKIAPSGETLCEVLTSPTVGHAVLGRDLYQRFQQAFFCGKESSMSFTDLKELVALEEKCIYHGILVLAKTPELDGVPQVISTKKEWRSFRRLHLVKWEIDGSDILLEAPMIFPLLFIHPDTKKDLDTMTKTHKVGIINCLSVLNDFFFSDLKSFKGTNPEFVAHFGPSHGLDGSSFEGSGDEKFYRSFNGVQRYCEPHLKMYTDDNGTKDRHCRVYFEFPSNPEREKLIFVGYICAHL